MFTRAQNIDRAFKQVRRFALLFAAGCLLLTFFVIYQSYRLAAQAGERIYVLAGGKAIEALASGRKDNIPVEARDHVRMFHYYFFTLDPDEKVIQANISKALYLADGSAKRQYDNLKESNYYAALMAGNVSQEVSVDSVLVDVAHYPYYFRCYGTQRIIRLTSITTRSLLTEGYLRNVSRSDNNAHGFLIEKWAILENKDVNTQNR